MTSSQADAPRPPLFGLRSSDSARALAARVLARPLLTAAARFAQHCATLPHRLLAASRLDVLHAPELRRESGDARFRGLFESAPDAIVILDSDGRVVSANVQAERLFGYARAEVTGLLVELLLPEWPRARCEQDRQQSITTPGSRPVGNRLDLFGRRRDGSEFPVEVSISALETDQGPLITAIVRDVTERRTAESTAGAASRHVRDEHSILLERLALLAQSVGTARTLPDVFRALTGFVLAATPSHGLFASLYEPERRERDCVYAWAEGEEVDVTQLPPLPLNESPHSQAIVTGQVIVTDDFQAALAKTPHVDLGSERDSRLPAASLAVPMLVQGRAIGAFEVQSPQPAAYTGEHIAALRMAANLAAIAVENVKLLEGEQQLRRAAEASEARFRRLAENAPDLIYRYRLVPERGFEYVSPAVTSIVGYTPEEHYADPDLELKIVHPDDRPLLEQMVRGEVTAGTPIVIRCVRKDGAVVSLEQRSVPVVEEGVPVALEGIARDITERRQAEEALQQLADELRRSNQELEHFAYVASHDLQAPLRTIIGFLQLLERRHTGKLDAEADELIGYALDGARRMQALITDLLAYARVNRRGKPLAMTDSGAALAQALKSLAATIGEAGAVVTHEPMPAVLADGAQLAQLFENLIGNALKFRGSRSPRVHAGAQRSPSEWRFSVSDNGIGIEPEDRERIFGMYQRLHASDEYPGTGIGLAICHKIVERHGGRIWVESVPGEGSTFFFTLPDQAGSAE